ncbi:MAG: TetR/AcrR family transcriptional regulator [Lachnospiraceae bacterium]|nr:TetR/AcrR family transcriptional regulator [Lachnospiraceae bacterium]
MARRNKQEELMNTTYVVVAENGIDTFSMKTVTTRLGVSEGLIYKYFDTREGLLFKSFVSFQKEIEHAVLEKTTIDLPGESAGAKRERIWKELFAFLLESNYKALFYYEYRWSFRYNEYLKLMESSEDENRLGLMKFGEAILGRPIMTNTDLDAVNWVVENTGFAVKKALLGDMRKDDETIHRIYKRIFFGISDILE